MLSALTVYQPGAAGTPAGANAHIVDGEQGAGIVGQECRRIALVSNGDYVVIPTHPEATEFASVQDAGCGHFGHIGLLAIFAYDGLAVLPAAQEDLVNGRRDLGTRGERQMGILGRTHLEREDATAGRKELVFQFIGCVHFCKTNQKYI